MGLGMWLGACRDPGTALYVTIEFPPTLLMDQLLVSGRVDGSSVGPHLLPEHPNRFLSNRETFRVLMPSAPDGAHAELHVEGLREGTRVARGTSVTEIQEGREVDVFVRLELAPPVMGDGGFCPSCAAGCCMGGICTASTFNTCGTGGIACTTCDPHRADSCAPAGFCACGQGPACDALAADRCEGGQCKCGGSGPCGFGQECVSGQCVCTSRSCRGCCSGSTCEPGTEQSKCGSGGVACRKCTRCIEGVCR
jgi:hypothetical protein